MKILLVFCFVLLVVAGERGARHSPQSLRRHAAASRRLLPVAAVREPTTLPQPAEQENQGWLSWIQSWIPTISWRGGKPVPPAYLTRKLQLALEGVVGVDLDDDDAFLNGNPRKRLRSKASRKHVGAKKRALYRGPSDLNESNDWNIEVESEKPSKDDLLEHLEISEAEISEALNQYGQEHTPEEIREMIINVGIGIIMNWKNSTEGHHAERKFKREEASFLQNLTGFIKFLAVLTDYMKQCEGREHDCVKELAEVMMLMQEGHHKDHLILEVKPVVEEHPVVEARLANKCNSGQNLALEAVKELAEKLETSSDPNDEALLALAHALLKLHDDLEQHIAEHGHSISNNVIVVLDVYEVLLTIDNCHQDETCVNDLLNVYGQI